MTSDDIRKDVQKVRAGATRLKTDSRDFNVNEIAVAVGANRNTVYGLVKNGELGHYKIGRLIRITQSHLDAFRAGNSGGDQ